MWCIYTVEYNTEKKTKQWHLKICEQMGGSRKHHIEWGNPHPGRQISHVLTDKWLLDRKQRKTRLQFIIPENLDNNEGPKRDIHGSKLHGM